MKTLNQTISGLFNLLFGEFNGVQAFLYPLSLFWWIDSDSFVYAVSGLLTTHKHFFPLCLFLLLLAYVLFLIVKNYPAIFSDDAPHTASERRAFSALVIGLHKVLLITVAVIGLIYVLSAFLKYYYGLNVPLKVIYPYVFRAFSIFLILYYTLRNKWTKPYRDRGWSMERAVVLLRGDYRARPWPYVVHVAILSLMIFVGAFIYQFLINNFIFPLTFALGITPNLYLAAPVGFVPLLYDVFIFGVAFMLSNLLFSPLVVLISHYSNLWLPKALPASAPPTHAEALEKQE